MAYSTKQDFEHILAEWDKNHDVNTPEIKLLLDNQFRNPKRWTPELIAFYKEFEKAEELRSPTIVITPCKRPKWIEEDDELKSIFGPPQ